MREPTFYVLTALPGGPLHGYAIMKRAGELSGGSVAPTGSPRAGLPPWPPSWEAALSRP
jgi:DNA-binding PadR family transcriptional regulator